MTSLFNRIALYPTLLYNVAMSKVTSRNWYDRIDDTVILGALPFRWMTKTLYTEENVRGVVSLNEDFEMENFVNTEEEWLAHGIKQLRVPTIDYVGTPAQTDINKSIDFILEHRHRQESVYVHCKAGRTRSATVVACYLIQLHGWTPDAAVDFVKEKRPHIWLRDKQLESIQTFYDQLKNSSAKGG